MEWRVKLGGRAEDGDKLAQGVEYARFLMNITTVNETSLVNVLCKLITNLFYHLLSQFFL